jgi:hypothetical protein
MSETALLQVEKLGVVYHRANTRRRPITTAMQAGRGEAYPRAQTPRPSPPSIK